MGETKPSTEEIEKQFRALAERTNTEKPKPADVKAFREFLRAHPKLWERLGDLSIQARFGFIDNMNGPSVMKESLQVGMWQLEKKFAQPNDTPLEHILIEQIILCWLRLNYVEMCYSARLKESISLAVGLFWEKRLNAAQVRYLKAIETLARVRRLNRPQLQLNIADKQVNIAQGSAAQANAPANVLDAESMTV